MIYPLALNMGMKSEELRTIYAMLDELEVVVGVCNLLSQRFVVMTWTIDMYFINTKHYLAVVFSKDFSPNEKWPSTYEVRVFRTHPSFAPLYFNYIVPISPSHTPCPPLPAPSTSS